MITPLLLAGGSGTRLWPLSRKSYPKQFARVIGSESLFQASAKRLSGTGYSAPITITSSDYRFIVTEQLSSIGLDPGAILIEPEAKNTAPAVLAAALYLSERDPEALMLVAPADHVISDTKAFRNAVETGVESAKNGKIVTFGIQPTSAETGYGWLQIAGSPQNNRPIDLKRFIEKPNKDDAEAMLEAGTFLWNAGIFLFKVSTILKAFDQFAVNVAAPTKQAVANAQPDLGFLRLCPKAWAKIPSISIDYAIMEHAPNLTVVPYGSGWSDLGSWEMVSQELKADDDGVSSTGDVMSIDCEDCLLRSDSDGLTLVGIGVKNIIAVAMNDAVLLADRSRAQDVKQAVEKLKARGAKQAETFLCDHRPWGWFETLALADRFQVKRIVVNPGAALSLQSHVHRSEHWIVVSGTAKVTVDGSVSLVTENQSIYVPLGAVHRMENPGKLPMILIEVQTGAYLGEDDIIRYEDIYSRGQGAKG
ncbi:mannose-1-phosphate guanylyltransferase/mannose-6-phosphate isomerase [Roseibium aggregatum]|uniref:mannose-1-phosphate guanylyltransferase n=1 Tax=Roseibium aggregatum TaxID=187304 RepID=A0A926P1N8_9HYPH|nr:mannose-1-phosphate guanylyltransferase/mannose-6-phosphate isomerase [Roseibium aggregatum]MBD1549659.1 mannose-1-phosphate guanylyltransferase/mannose-6-phosphate isomerase [Roseibium aggregatum]